ncbi:MAG: hypothetical protein HQL73_00085 [Magnetococcales bacterium]|nr:hypothetical protein [Magnetococcales bacterium]
MMDECDLDNVIRRVDNIPAKTEPGQVLVTVDIRTGQYTLQPPLPLLRRKHHIFYIVGNSSSARHTAQCKGNIVTIADYSNDTEVRIYPSYRIVCPKGYEGMFAAAVAGEAPPLTQLNARIDVYVQDYLDKNEYLGKKVSKFFQNIKEERQRLADSIQESAKTEMRAFLSVRIHLEGESDLATFHITDLHIPVHLKDATDAFNVIIVADLNVDPDNRITALMRYKQVDQLPEIVSKMVKAFCRDTVSVNEFFKGFDESGLTSKLRELLLARLRKVGRVLGRFIVRADKVDGFPKDVYCSFKFEHTPFGYPNPITIDNHLQLRVEDIAKYRSRGALDIQIWARETLTRTIKDAIFEWSYLEILLEFEELRKKIESKLAEEATRVGCAVKVLISRPIMKENSYRELKTYPFLFQNLPTKETGLTVNLNVAATLSIPDLMKIKDFLDRQENILSIMETASRAALENILHHQDPETVFMRFTDSVREVTLQGQLQEAIKRKLEDSLFAQVQNVTVSPAPNQMVDHIQKMIGASKPEEFIVDLRGHGKPYCYCGNLWVTGVHENGWERIKQHSFQLSDIVNYFVSFLTAELVNRKPDQLTITSAKHREMLETFINHKASEEISKRFGMKIEIANFRLSPSEILKKLGMESELNLETQLKVLESQRSAKATVIQQNQAFLEAENQGDLNKLADLTKEMDKARRRVGGNAFDDEDDGRIFQQLKEEGEERRSHLGLTEFQQNIVPGVVEFDSLVMRGTSRQDGEASMRELLEEIDKGNDSQKPILAPPKPDSPALERKAIVPTDSSE